MPAHAACVGPGQRFAPCLQAELQRQEKYPNLLDPTRLKILCVSGGARRAAALAEAGASLAPPPPSNQLRSSHLSQA